MRADDWYMTSRCNRPDEDEALVGAWLYTEDSGWYFDRRAPYKPDPYTGCISSWPNHDPEDVSTSVDTC